MELFPHDSKIDFLRLRTIAAGLSVLLLLASIGLLATRGLNFALDFTGGTVAELQFEKPIDLDAARAKLEEAGYDNPVVLALGTTTDVLIRLQPKEGEGAEQAQNTGGDLLTMLQTPDNRGKVLRSDFVGPQVGKELAENGLLAVLFVAIGFVIYITLRFEWKFAVAAIATTLFDVVATTGLFAATQSSFDLPVLAGVLSVMGYSINDKIVVFDRVRENFKTLHRLNSYEVLNRSVNQTLSRTVITSFVAFLTVLALYIFGGASLEGMAEAQMFGIVLGTLSSIFVACPLMYWLGASKQDLMPKARDESELARRP